MRRGVKFSLGAATAAALLVAGCSAVTGAGYAASPPLERVTADTVRTTYSRPDDWHRLALFGNRDFVDAAAWRTIVTQPDCDQATALAIFWMASPEYYVQFTGRADVPDTNRDGYDLIVLIRDRWRAGAYTRAELAFDPDIDVWPVDRAELRRRYGERVDRLMPQSMRVRLQGRRLDRGSTRAPGVIG